MTAELQTIILYEQWMDSIWSSANDYTNLSWVEKN